MGKKTVRQIYHALLANKLIAELEKRNIEAAYYETGAGALRAALALLDNEASVSWGGSATLHEIGLIDAVTSGGYNVLDPNAPQSAAGKEDVARRALAADYYFMGCNAIAQTGEMVHSDGIGNRVAALAFGPKNIVVIAGLNKVEPDLDAALRRVENKAAPMILLKFKSDFKDFDALAEAAAKAGNHLAVTSGSAKKGRIKVLLVGEELGF